MGAEIEASDDGLAVSGVRMLKGAGVSSCNDHRIAMAAAVAGLRTQDGIEIFDWKCVSKSYPDFFRDLEYISRRVK